VRRGPGGPVGARARHRLSQASGSPRRGDSVESGWSISVGRQTSGAEPADHGITGETGMTIKNKTVLVTGANRGIGQALVEEALRR
jgi:hypothetical protein